jgi:hypothetical protein
MHLEWLYGLNSIMTLIPLAISSVLGADKVAPYLDWMGAIPPFGNLIQFSNIVWYNLEFFL